MAQRQPPTPFKHDPERQELYLFWLAGGRPGDTWPGKTGAARLAGVAPSTVARLRKEDPEFADREDQAVEAYRDRLRHEADRRGRRGILKAVYHQGQRVGRERQYSDRILVQLLRAHCPEHRERVEVDNRHSGGLHVGLEGLRDLSESQLGHLRALLEEDGGSADA